MPFALKLLPVSVISVPIGPELGLKEVIVGAAAFEKVTLSVAVEVFPAASVAFTVMTLAPAVRATEQLKEPLCTVAGAPLQVTAATPDKASDAVPVTETEDVLTVAPFAGDVMLMTGGTLSTPTISTVRTPPGFPRTWTSIVLAGCRVTVTSTSTTF